MTPARGIARPQSAFLELAGPGSCPWPLCYHLCGGPPRHPLRDFALPFTEAKLPAAVLTCERDHVAFIDNEAKDEVARPKSTAVGDQQRAAGSLSPRQRLVRFLLKTRGRGFVDVRPSANRCKVIDSKGVIGKQAGRDEYGSTTRCSSASAAARSRRRS
jgi:hypothetical protein